MHLAAQACWEDACLILIACGVGRSGVRPGDEKIAQILAMSRLLAAAHLGDVPVLIDLFEPERQKKLFGMRLKEAMTLAELRKNLGAADLMRIWMANAAARAAI